MGNKKNKSKSANAPSASAGKRKEVVKRKNKTKNKELDTEAEPVPYPTPRPLQRVNLVLGEKTPSASAPTADADLDAVSALLAMGNRSQALQKNVGFQDRMDHIFAATVPGVSLDELREDREEQERSRGSGSEGSEDDLGSKGSDDSSSSSSLDDDLEMPVSSPVKVVIPKFTIAFEVPFNGASREFDAHSHTPFDRFLDKVATNMGTRKSLLTHIAWVPSYAPKNAKFTPKLLENKTDWNKLIAAVDGHITAAKGKNGKGVVKPFCIYISDTSGGGEPKASSGTKKGKDKSALPLDIPDASSKEQKFYRQLEQQQNCAEHDRPCWILATGDHYHLTAADLAKWAYLIHEHRATTKVIPTELNILDAAPRQHAAKKAIAHNTPAAASSTEPPEWIRQLLPIMGIAMGTVVRNNTAPFETPPPCTPQPQLTAGSSWPALALDSDAPSSGTKRAATISAPSTRNWLADLDADYLDAFEANALFDLMDMENLSVEDLSWYIGAPIGHARRLIKYAKEDLLKITTWAKRARYI
ncbi:hypothetical protein C8R43DRAFT_953478 [Mycena crocata]|nr:hypothetical protein C8R43DRAFT_953478 [Mycena crocata]